MATRKYSKKAKARKQRTYRKRKAYPKKKKTPALSKRQEAMFFSLRAGTLDDSEE